MTGLLAGPHLLAQGQESGQQPLAMRPVTMQGFATSKRAFSGVYPALASFNESGECGIWALLSHAGKLWWITYPPHAARGSDDLLRAIDTSYELFVGEGSVGGTAACRALHEATGEALIGPYRIAADGTVRAILPASMPGRLTGIAAHLFEPATKVYYATMEEGFYEVDLVRDEVRTLFPDANGTRDSGGTLLPGYHGKGLFAAQGVLVYANNGEHSALARERPDVTSGVLALK
ncbi:MAG TPA: hypothetical protein PKE00_02595 [Planctomycetota bacterium]|nr:hypothetical protein [Planctomycetota bacterium]